MNKRITIPFQVTLWDLKPYEESEGAPTLMRGTVKKSFDGDEIKGESTGEILLYSAADGSAAYTVMDKFTIELDGKKGTFIALHGATHTPGGTSRALGQILSSSGTGDFQGISGQIEFKQDDKGKTLDFDLTLPEAD